MLLYHTMIEVYPVTPAAGTYMYRMLPFQGPLAVIIFFIVSGYALSVGFLHSRRRSNLHRIFIGRYFRLVVPIFISCMLVYAATKTGLILAESRRDIAASLPNVLQFAFFDVFFNNRTPGMTPIPQLWTMPIELAGSAIVLVVLWLVGTLSVRWIVYVVALIFLIVYNLHYAAFIVGVLLAEANTLRVSDRTRNWASTIATCLLPAALLSVALLPDRPLWAFLCIATAITVCATFSAPARRFLSNRISRFLGLISFPLYLLHGLVLHTFGVLVMRYADSPLAVLIADVLIVATAMAIAYAFKWTDNLGIIVSHKVAAAVIKTSADSYRIKPQ